MSIATEVASSSPAAPSEAKEIVVNSAAEFVAQLAQLDQEIGTETFYRGHADKGWKLTPWVSVPERFRQWWTLTQQV